MRALRSLVVLLLLPLLLAAGGFFRCDTAHDGGAAEHTVRFGSPAARPLLGNVDGI